MSITVILCQKELNLSNLRFALKKGALSVDFVFTFCAGLLLLLYFLMVSFTLSLMEVSQYIAFKTSRTYFAGHNNFALQENKAQAEFNRLKNLFFKPSMNNWFTLRLENVQSDRNAVDSEEANLLLGTQLTFTSKVLGLSIPFLKDDTGDVEFEVSSYLGREPSQTECINFKIEKFEKLRQLNSAYSMINVPSGFQRVGNGC